MQFALYSQLPSLRDGNTGKVIFGGRLILPREKVYKCQFCALHH